MSAFFTSLVSFIQKKSIASRLLFYILLTSFIFTLIATVLQLYLDYRSEMGSIDRQINQIKSSYLKSLSKSTWDMDTKGLDFQLEGALQLQDIKYLEIRTELGQILAFAGKPPGEMSISQRFHLEYKHLGEVIVVGTLDVVATWEGVDSRSWNKIVVIVSTQAIKIFCMSD